MMGEKKKIDTVDRTKMEDVKQDQPHCGPHSSRMWIVVLRLLYKGCCSVMHGKMIIYVFISSCVSYKECGLMVPPGAVTSLVPCLNLGEL